MSKDKLNDKQKYGNKQHTRSASEHKEPTGVHFQPVATFSENGGV